ncbi:hypothetical protein TIFTF001_020434 [Ficus carica]|uniref:Uncharacterized protein n=1 Tax=Ficus carica TaxID=3494 RepID=A0AA88DDN3_FICCA|nr:hypothetical protein TIFTF001_020434 [Ficus carica]
METRWRWLVWRSSMEARSELRGRKIGASPTAAISSQTPSTCRSSQWLPVIIAVTEAQSQREREERDRERRGVWKK